MTGKGPTKTCRCGEPVTTWRPMERVCPGCAEAFDRGFARGLDPKNWPWYLWALWSVTVGVTIGKFIAEIIR